MAKLPQGGRAILDLRKIEDYCLNPAHPRSRHKARLFGELLDIHRNDARWLGDVFLQAAREFEAAELATDAFGRRFRIDVRVARQNRGAVVRTVMDHKTRGRNAAIRDLLGALMTTEKHNKKPDVLDPVALLADDPESGLARGQAGTVVESLADDRLLVEFSDDNGYAYAMTPYSPGDLLVLHYEPETV